MTKKKRMSQKEFDIVWRALFEGVKHPETKMKDPDRWRG